MTIEGGSFRIGAIIQEAISHAADKPSLAIFVGEFDRKQPAALIAYAILKERGENPLTAGGIKAGDLTKIYNDIARSGLYADAGAKEEKVEAIGAVLKSLHDAGLATHPWGTNPAELLWSINHQEPAPEVPATPPATA